MLYIRGSLTKHLITSEFSLFVSVSQVLGKTVISRCSVSVDATVSDRIAYAVDTSVNDPLDRIENCSDT